MPPEKVLRGARWTWRPPVDREALREIETLLSDAKYDFGSSEVNRDTLTAMRKLSDALARVRALLAESQETEPYSGDEPLGTCVIHGDYWTDDCLRCDRA